MLFLLVSLCLCLCYVIVLLNGFDGSIVMESNVNILLWFITGLNEYVYFLVLFDFLFDGHPSMESFCVNECRNDKKEQQFNIRKNINK